ncbi:hypothetical protein BC937DRAFT_94357 [Endogone sp. FLAS-F59071]|nr:hypothetical protein BC937DRAFT_94357 [Endogone sp. FLAS-F59071]|eukprot:RUS14090.1 hypothetical protein BC937DRAFT_94357 [Endogone sp. FLAS-F59071]
MTWLKGLRLCCLPEYRMILNLSQKHIKGSTIHAKGLAKSSIIVEWYDVFEPKIEQEVVV